MNYTREQLQKTGEEIVSFIRNDYLLSDGLVSAGFVNGEKLQKNILADLGDYLPFLYLFGGEDLCEKQIEEIEKKFENKMLLSTRKKFGLKIVQSYDYTDLLLGLMDYYELSDGKRVLELAEKIFDFVILNFGIFGSAKSFYLPELKLRLPVLDTRDGMFIELMLQMGKITGNEKYFKLSEKLFKNFSELRFFKKNRVFPKYSFAGIFEPLSGFVPKFNKIIIMKHNSNTLFAFLEFYKETKSAKAKEAIEKFFGVISALADAKNGLICNDLEKDSSLTANFSIIDFLCDCGKVFEVKDFIDKAKQIADFWLSRQSETTGLFPRDAGTMADDLDCCTDMTVALMKLAEVSGDEKYARAAEKCFEGIIGYHKKEKGFVLSVDIRDGKVLDPQFKTKFITLFLKAIYLFMEKAEQKTIYGNTRLFNLLKDR